MSNFLKGRRVKDILIYFLYVPKISSSIKNWVQYLKSYGRPFAGLIYFRNGLKLRINDALDTSSISVIFFKKEYGNINDNTTVLDIGANRGYFSMYAANTSKNTKIYAFEPVKKTYNSVVEHIEMNGFKDRVIPINKGVAGSNGVRTFAITSSISNSMVFEAEEHSEVQSIDCISLQSVMDDYELDQINLIKMDCEGAEYEIFYNTSDDYLARIDEIRMEYHYIDDDKQNVEALIKHMETKNFSKSLHDAPGLSTGIVWFTRNK
jgi:FkbM family methyltransferase